MANVEIEEAIEIETVTKIIKIINVKVEEKVQLNFVEILEDSIKKVEKIQEVEIENEKVEEEIEID